MTEAMTKTIESSSVSGRSKWSRSHGDGIECRRRAHRLPRGSALYWLGMATVRNAFAELLHSGRQEALNGAWDPTYQELAEVLQDLGQR